MITQFFCVCYSCLLLLLSHVCCNATRTGPGPAHRHEGLPPADDGVGRVA